MGIDMKHLLPLLLVALFGVSLHSSAQCSASPADCPESTDYGSADDSTSRMGNPLLPLEITMENRLRQWANDHMGRITEKEHWTYTEITEGFGSGYRTASGAILAYPLRPPHWFSFRFQIVTDPDSLAAWNTWLQTFAQRRLDATMAYAKQQASQSAALKANDDFENERRRQTIHFRETSTLTVEFEFNMDDVKLAGVPASQPPAPASQSPAPASPSGLTTIWYNNPRPEFNAIDPPERVHTNVVVLAGSFTRNPNGGGYRPTWQTDKAATNQSGQKKFKCDQLQSIDCHLSGNTAAIRKWLADFPSSELTALLVKP
jgi:hypothetical protein